MKYLGARDVIHDYSFVVIAFLLCEGGITSSRFVGADTEISEERHLDLETVQQKFIEFTPSIVIIDDEAHITACRVIHDWHQNVPGFGVHGREVYKKDPCIHAVEAHNAEEFFGEAII